MNNFYSKVSILFKEEKLYSKRQNGYNFKKIKLIDISEDHNLNLNSASIDDFKVEIEIKKSMPLWTKSISLSKFNCLYVNIIPDRLLCKLTLGPNELGASGIHWKKMVEQPEEKIFAWYEL